MIVRLLFVVMAALGVALPIGAQAQERLWTQKGTSGPAAEIPLTSSTFSRLADQLLPTVVSLSVKASTGRPGRSSSGDPVWDYFFGVRPERQRLQEGLGTGVIIHRDGFVLTNNHVIENAVDIQVSLNNGKHVSARLVGADPRTDLALLKLDGQGPYPVAPLGDSEGLRIGEWVMAIGSPFGLNQTVTAGIVSAKGRKDLGSGTEPSYANFIQTDASINPGNSGGPLINLNGEVIGINTAIVQSAQGIGFAIPSNMAKQLIPQLATGQVQRSWLGVGIQKLSDDLARSLGLRETRGALVARVYAGSPAEDADLRVGDVVLRFGNQDLEDSSDLPWLAATAGAGASIPLVIWRDGKTLNATVVMGRLEDGGEGTRVAPRASSPKAPSATPETMDLAGMTLRDPSSAERRANGLGRAVGVVVDRVNPEGAAAAAGLRPGDVVLRIGYTRLAAVAHLRKVASTLARGSMVSLHVLRNGEYLWVAVRL
jgi:serine protease Do